MTEDRRKLWPYVVAPMALPAALAIAYLLFPDLAGRLFLAAMSSSYATRAPSRDLPLSGTYEGKDTERERLTIGLEPVCEGFTHPTDLQFAPGAPHMAVVLEQEGSARWVDMSAGKHGLLFQADVLSVLEQGLLGLAFHPDFARNGRFFINYVAEGADGDVTRIQAYRLKGDLAKPLTAEAEAGQILLEVAQPFQNHNGGQLVFGPDGMLYIGLGDGGLRADPKGNGQNRHSLLGAMLRIDVDGELDDDRPYGIPADNPFADGQQGRPEVWAYGLRNPWRYSFDGSGRLVVADVGQDRFEEVSIVRRGANLGWALKEGLECFPQDRDCSGDEGQSDPFLVYGRDEGQSITGGHVYTGQAIEKLRGHYVFGDFVSGKLWAVKLPQDDEPDARPAPLSLGDWPILPSAFGRDAQGELYVVGYGNGILYRLAPSQGGDAGLDAATDAAIDLDAGRDGSQP